MQVSVWNFVRYNVVGGGDSALYGVEPAGYYFKNGALNLNVALALFCLYPLVALLRLTGRIGRLSMPCPGFPAVCQRQFHRAGTKFQ